jgi:radical SAM protein with 4Fe4S-binding SPASM domain
MPQNIMIKKIKYFYRLLNIYFSYITRKQKVNYLPIKLWVEVSSNCNLKCRLCANKDLPFNEKGYMDFNLYKKIINEAKDFVNEINLFHRGEPLLHSQIIQMIKLAKKFNIKTTIHSNAVLLNKEISTNLIKSGLNTISFSFDGYTKSTYEKNRIGSNFENVLNNIIEFLKIKKELNSKLPYTIIQVMEYDEELSSLEFKKQKTNFINNFVNLPLDKLIIRKPHNWGGSINLQETNKLKFNKKNNYMGLKRDEIINKNINIYVGNENNKSKDNININEINEINEDKNNINNFIASNKKLSSACTFPWYSLVILFNGKVTPCPQDFFANIILGDVNYESLKDIFNNNKMQKLRNKFKNKTTSFDFSDNFVVCNKCDRCFRETIFGIPKEYLGKFLKDNIDILK